MGVSPHRLIHNGLFPVILAVCMLLILMGCGGGGNASSVPSLTNAAPLGPGATPRPPGGTPRPTPGPSAMPSTGPTPTPPPGGNVAGFQGCPVFTAGDWYNANVGAAAIDPNSAGYVNSLMQYGDGAGFWASTGIEFINLANSSTPRIAVNSVPDGQKFSVPYPWLPSYRIEPDVDHHAMVLDTSRCQLYELYGTQYSGGALSAYSGFIWNLQAPMTSPPAGLPSAMASGLSLFAGAVKWEEYLAGSINHALNWAPAEGSISQYNFVAPATDTGGLPFVGPPTAPQIPYGSHLRLRASFNTTGMGPQARAVVKAMQTYGIYLADTGGTCCGNALYFINAIDGSNPWDTSDLDGLVRIHISDFDVLRMPPLQRVPGR
ncbi:MAG: hypothetical protein JO193_00990 [Candidatus Eremiobacteraeota bacterium]|nr:hypothetical protein [Candidatus Eremiobacteraeota bacterium]